MNLCAGVACGPNAVCSGGKCSCRAGYEGDASDPKVGCSTGGCQNDLYCRDDEICLPSAGGQRRCVSACSKLSCGSNAYCVTENHRSSCLCKDGFSGDPSNPRVGCQPTTPADQCQTSRDCPKDRPVCTLGESGRKQCLDPCSTFFCDQNEVCSVRRSRPVCLCRDGFKKNPRTNRCESPGVPECASSDDCPVTHACLADALKVKKCAPVCDRTQCSPNSQCVALNHRASCQCVSGFYGNPNDRAGCKPLSRNTCSSDAECPETEACREADGSRQCVSVCASLRCGPGAVCVTNNHVAQCQCPPGKYVGDPADLEEGCQAVGCLGNSDCLATQACNQLDYQCYDVCRDACGAHAVCLAANHAPVCSCRPGYSPNPTAETDCASVDLCADRPCHSSAKCVNKPGSYSCFCPPRQIGDPYTTGCHPEGQCPGGDSDCPPDSVCYRGRCADPCQGACGQNAQCNVVQRKAQCSCPSGFQGNPEPEQGCVRAVVRCSSDAQCPDGVCISGQCRGEAPAPAQRGHA